MPDTLENFGIHPDFKMACSIANGRSRHPAEFGGVNRKCIIDIDSLNVIEAAK